MKYLLLSIKFFVATLVYSLVSITPGVADEEYAWHAKNVSQSLLLKINKLPSNRLVTLGERGHILWSDDNGKNWSQAKVPTKATLTGLFFLDEETGWAVGHDTIILKTIDGGETWKKQYSAVTQATSENAESKEPIDELPLFDVTFLNRRLGFAIGAYGTYLTTTNGGEDWQTQYLESLDDPEFGLPHFYQIKNVGDNKLMMVGEAGFIAIGGRNINSWSRTAVDYQGSFFAIERVNDGVLLAVGLRGNIYRSVNEGLTWLPIETEASTNLYSITMSQDKKIVVVGGADGVILISHDNGQHFRFYRKEDRQSIADIIFSNDGNLFSVGKGGIANVTSFLNLAK